MAPAKTRTGKDAPECGPCIGHEGKFRTDHKPKEKHRSYCSHCDMPGHHMSLCYNLKFCNLCGKAGHNPYRCWTFSTLIEWIVSARNQDRCLNCLRLWKPMYPDNNKYCICSHCGALDIYDVLLIPKVTKES